MTNRKIITVRVSESTYKRFRVKCQKEKRSMSAQGELLIDEFVGNIVAEEQENKTLDKIREVMGDM